MPPAFPLTTPARLELTLRSHTGSKPARYVGIAGISGVWLAPPSRSFKRRWAVTAATLHCAGVVSKNTITRRQWKKFRELGCFCMNRAPNLIVSQLQALYVFNSCAISRSTTFRPSHNVVLLELVEYISYTITRLHSAHRTRFTQRLDQMDKKRKVSGLRDTLNVIKAFLTAGFQLLESSRCSKKGRKCGGLYPCYLWQNLDSKVCGYPIDRLAAD